MAPAHDADTLRVDVRVGLEHPLLAGEHVLDLPPTVVDQPPELLAVAARAAIVWGQDGVALREQLAEDVDVVAVEVPVDPPVAQDDERQLGAGLAFPRKEGAR